MIDFTIWSSVQPAAMAACSAVRVSCAISSTGASMPDATSAAFTLARLLLIAFPLIAPSLPGLRANLNIALKIKHCAPARD